MPQIHWFCFWSKATNSCCRLLCPHILQALCVFTPTVCLPGFWQMQEWKSQVLSISQVCNSESRKVRSGDWSPSEALWLYCRSISEEGIREWSHCFKVSVCPSTCQCVRKLASVQDCCCPRTLIFCPQLDLDQIFPLPRSLFGIQPIKTLNWCFI